MNKLDPFFDYLITKTQKITNIIKDNDINLEIRFDVPYPESLIVDAFMSFVEAQKLGIPQKKKTNLIVIYSFLKGDDRIKLKINDEYVIENQENPSVITEIENEFKDIVGVMQNFFVNLDTYEQEIKNLNVDTLKNKLKKFDGRYHSLLYTWAYVLLRKGIYSDVLICFLLEEGALLDHYDSDEILDNIMMELKYTKLNEKDVAKKNAWGKYWKASIGRIPDINYLYFIIAQWYQERKQKYHAISVYDYWFNFEKLELDKEEAADYRDWKIPFYKNLGELYYEKGKYSSAKKAIQIYRKEINREDFSEVDDFITNQFLIDIENKIKKRVKSIKKLDYNTQAYAVLKEIEQKLREKIKLVLIKSYTNIPAWFENEPTHIKTYNKIIEQIRERYPELNEHDVSYDLFLDFTTINDLKYLILNNSKCFPIFRKDKNWLKILINNIDNIKYIRNDIAHFRKINKDTLDILTNSKNVILAIIKKIII